MNKVYIPDQETLMKAFDHLNAAVFGGELPRATIVPITHIDFVSGALKESVESPDFVWRSRNVGQGEILFREYWSSSTDPMKRRRECITQLAIYMLHGMTNLWWACGLGEKERVVALDSEWIAMGKKLGLSEPAADVTELRVTGKLWLTVHFEALGDRPLESLIASDFAVKWQ